MIIRLWQADFFGLFLPPSYFALSGFSVKRQKLRQTQIVFADKTVCVCFKFLAFYKKRGLCRRAV